MGVEIVAVAGLLLLGGGIALLVVNLGKSKGMGVVDQIGTYGYVAESVGSSEAEPRRPLDSLAGRVGDMATKRFGRFSDAAVRRKLVAAGMYGSTPRKILGYQILLAIFLSLAALWLVPALGGSAMWAIIAAVVGGALGWYLPNVYINRQIRLRFKQMDRQMPDMIDLLVVTVEAGLGLLASMRVASDTLGDPLGQELRLTLQEQRMGLSMSEALENFGQRADTDNVRIFIRSLTQGEKLGISIGVTLRNLALEMRKRRRAMVEEQAQKLPIKMLFPLGFLILPAIFIVLLVPAFIRIFQTLG